METWSSNSVVIVAIECIPETIAPCTGCSVSFENWRRKTASTVTAGIFLEVQKYSCLYNKFCKGYNDKYVKINCWWKIGETF